MLMTGSKESKSCQPLEEKGGAYAVEINTLIGYDLPMSTGQGSAGNVIAALASFFISGLGQLIQGRLLRALVFFLAAVTFWWVGMGWIFHLWSCIDAALWKAKS